MTAMTPEEKRELVARFGRDENDTGATEVQIALLTRRINHLTQHLPEAAPLPLPPVGDDNMHLLAGSIPRIPDANLVRPSRPPRVASR